MRRPMRIKLAVKRVEIVAPFYTGRRFHLMQVGHVSHKTPDVGRILQGGKEICFLTQRCTAVRPYASYRQCTIFQTLSTGRTYTMEEKSSSILVAVDVVLFAVRNKSLHVLLVERGRPPFQGMWAFPGGLVEPDEPLAQAARRELAEETGVRDVPFLTQLAAFGRPDRDPRGRVISVAYLGLTPRAWEVKGADDAARALWWPVDALPELAFDHGEILACARRRLQEMVEHDIRLLFHLVPTPFVLSELRHACEAALGRAVDKRNFRRALLRHDWLEPGGLRHNIGRGRPAREYRPRPDAVPPSPDDVCR